MGRAAVLEGATYRTRWTRPAPALVDGRITPVAEERFRGLAVGVGLRVGVEVSMLP